MLTATVKEEFIKMEKSVDQTNIKLAFITMPLIITLYFNDRYKINNNKKYLKKLTLDKTGIYHSLSWRTLSCGKAFYLK